VNSNTCRLIDHEHRVIFINDRQFGLEFSAGDDFSLPNRDPYWRNSNHIVRTQAIGRLPSFPINPDFATADNSVDVAFGDTLTQLQQEVVEPLSILVFGNRGLSNRIFAYFGHFEYTDFDLRLGLKEALTRETVERRRLYWQRNFRQAPAASLAPTCARSNSANHLVKYAHQK
jgi:hypothetical protein